MEEDLNPREINRFLDAIEDGNLSTADAYNILRTIDPLMGYFLLTYLREKHPVNAETSHGPGERLLALLSTYSDIAKLTKKPIDDPMIEWFDDTYSYRQFFKNRDEFVNILIEKFEG